ncbi:MAG: hydB [Firmicutes bacterium]|nr:hydB [Bacillota bacterium]
MAHYDYEEKKLSVSRREFLGLLGVGAAVIWMGAYVTTDLVKNRKKYIRMRAQGLYKDDGQSVIRQSHNNKALMDMYAQFAGKPLSTVPQELFHTKYVDRINLGGVI